VIYSPFARQHTLWCQWEMHEANAILLRFRLLKNIQ
jgi:hypothetical protein